MAVITIQERSISVSARMLGELVGNSPPPGRRRKRGQTVNANAPAVPLTQQELEYQNMLAKLHNKAMSGDLSAMKTWLEMNAPVSDKAFDLEINITPYHINDRELSRIVMQADTPVVQEMFEGVATRLSADGAPRTLKELWRCFRGQYDEWAREAYAPKDV